MPPQFDTRSGPARGRQLAAGHKAGRPRCPDTQPCRLRRPRAAGWTCGSQSRGTSRGRLSRCAHRLFCAIRGGREPAPGGIQWSIRVTHGLRVAAERRSTLHQQIPSYNA
jgi:hypothetical protein